MVLHIRNFICYIVFLYLIYAGLAKDEENQFHAKLATTSTPQENCQNALFPEPPCCGIFNELLNITHSGVGLGVNELPWIVYINGTHKSDFCSGSLINSRWVLTTAECIFNKLGGEWKLQVFLKSEKPEGEYSASEIQKFVVIKTILHELYDSLSEENSIALLLLSKPVIFSYVLKPVCLPKDVPTNALAGQLGVVATWGNNTNNTWQINSLPKALVVILDSDTCKKYAWDFSPEMCGKKMRKENEFYTEDSGGPLMIALPNEKGKSNSLCIIGLTHFSGEKYYDSDIYSYVNVTKYLKWIYDTVTKNQPKFINYK